MCAHSTDRGQASADYVALLALVGVALAGAAAAGEASALGDVPARVARVVRTGICVVGGDVCRTADAAAAGLAPCVLGERTTGGGLTVSIVSLRLGQGGEWTVAERSDGSVLVTRSDEDRAGVGIGVGFEAGGLAAGVSGSADVEVRGGSAWELPSTAAAARFLAAVRAGEPPGTEPAWRFGDAGEVLEASAGIDALGIEVTGLEASAAAAAGARAGRGRTTLYVHAGLEAGGALDRLPGAAPPPRGTSAAPGGGRTGPLLLALTRDAGGLREIAFRRVDTRPGELVETSGRLDLRDPANRAAAEPLLARRLPWPAGVARDLRAVIRRTAQAGTVERAVYAIRDRSRRIDAAVRLGAELGLEADTVDVEHALRSASAWTAGSPERHREDCAEALRIRRSPR